MPHLRLDEVETRQAAIKARIKELDRKYAGQRFPDDERAEWNALNAEFENLETDRLELRAKHRRLETLGPRRTPPRAGNHAGTALRRASRLQRAAA